MVSKNLEQKLKPLMRCNNCKEYTKTFITCSTDSGMVFECIKCRRKWR